MTTLSKHTLKGCSSYYRSVPRVLVNLAEAGLDLKGLPSADSDEASQ